MVYEIKKSKKSPSWYQKKKGGVGTKVGLGKGGKLFYENTKWWVHFCTPSGKSGDGGSCFAGSGGGKGKI